jgi:hypothetical protein
MAMAERGAALLPKNGRPRFSGAISVALTALAATVVLSAIGGGPGAHTLLERDARLAPTPKLAQSFDADTLYSDSKGIDQDHPNRIDGYGCLFTDCDSSGKDNLLTKGPTDSLATATAASHCDGPMRKPVSELQVC